MERFNRTTAAFMAAASVVGSPALAGPSVMPETGKVQIRLSIANGESVTATLADGEGARAFAALLPMTLTMKDYNATEKIADLPKRLPTQGEPEGFEPRAGDIAYYAPWGNIAIYYEGFAYSPGLIRLGNLSRIPEAFRSAAPIAVTIDIARKRGPARPRSNGEPIMKKTIMALAASTLAAGVPANADETKRVTVQHAGSLPSKAGPDAYFTGSVRIDQPFKGTGDARVSGATVTFQPGARTAWHTHPLGQTLLVVSGAGRVQQDGEPIQSIKPGDAVWIPAGVKHWHGAVPDSAMSHVAIAEALDSKVVDWMEKVTDAQYRD